MEETEIDEELTVGPNWAKAEEPAEEVMTVGPAWSHTPTAEAEEATVGPVFYTKETVWPQIKTASKVQTKKPDVRWGRIGIAVVLIGAIVIVCMIGLSGSHTPG